jgi:hypothetical protein
MMKLTDVPLSNEARRLVRRAASPGETGDGRRMLSIPLHISFFV